MRVSKGLYPTLLAVGFTVGSMSVYAAQDGLPAKPPNVLPGLSFPGGIATYDPAVKAPNFSPAEQGLHCAAESAVSLKAAIIAHKGCTASTYPVVIDIDGTGVGTLSIGPSATFTVDSNVGRNVKGVFCHVDEVSPASIGGTVIDDYPGRHAWSSNSWIFNSSADPIIFDGFNEFDEHNIKDFYRWTNNGGKKILFFDWGLEKITKFGYPREKWWQWSKYQPEDGSLDPGILRYWKRRLVPHGAPCSIHLDLTGTNISGAQYSGTLTEFPSVSP
jgi:hypothetical protein